MAFNIADLFEYVSDVVPDRIALIADDDRRTFAELDERSNRFAHHLRSAGIEPGDHVGIHALNSAEWVEAMYGCYKARAVPINVNFRYVEDELRYLYDNADLVAVVHDRDFSPRIAHIRDEIETLRHLVVIDDGSDTDLAGLDSVPYDEALTAASPERDFAPRSPDDLYILYTGGTTGMPKGVMWRQEDVIFALGGGIDALTGQRATHDHELAERAAASGGPIMFLAPAPMMHGASQWAVMGQGFVGNGTVLMAHFSPEQLWRQVEREGVNSILITGDAMGRPLIEYLEDHPEIDVSSVLSLSSTAAVFSPSVKDRFLERFPDLILTDSIGSSESGFNGIKMVAKGDTAMSAGGPTVTAGPNVVILTEDRELIPPESDEVGHIGRGGNIPQGYYKDPEKTAATFVTAADGNRYSVPGDFARWATPGQITLMGRGSVSINSGGEKIFPEEVEHALKAHPAVYDCVVVGRPDERWGQRVCAVVQLRPDVRVELEELQDHARTLIAGYKVPRELHPVDEILRSPAGKPDYRWALAVAEGRAASVAEGEGS